MESKVRSRKTVSSVGKALVPSSYSGDRSTQHRRSTSLAAAASITTATVARSLLSSTANMDKWKTRTSERGSASERRRVTTLKWGDFPYVSARPERGRDSTSTTSSRRRWHTRNTRMLHAAFFSLLFVAAMRRVAARYRERVIWETVEKPRAAFRVQTAWRAYQQRRRIKCKTAAGLLGPILRSKITCIRLVREKCALFLQRVFRSQRERHIVHWLCLQMKYNRALNVVRKFLERCVAKRYLMFLTLQRDERVVCEERCAMAAQSLIREERSELLSILHWINTITQSNITPLATKSMPEYVNMHDTRYSWRSPHSLVTGMRNVNKNFSLSVPSSVRETLSEKNPLALSTSGEEIIHSCGHGTLEHVKPCTWTSLLHDEKSARHLIDELFRRKPPSYPLLKGESVQHSLTRESTTLYESTSNSQMEPKKVAEPEIICGLCFFPSRPVSARVGNDVIDAFLELLVLTESIERKTLESERQNCYKELMQHMNWVVTLLKATKTAPPLYASLLASIPETWLVQQAELLFHQERQNRLKLLREYEAVPLRFLNRPFLSFAAEERRTRLVKRVRVIKEVGESSEGVMRANSTLEVGQYQERKGNKDPLTPSTVFAHSPLRPPSAERLVAAKPFTLRPTSASASRPPLPPSPPPRKREDISSLKKSSIHQGGRRLQRQQRPTGLTDDVFLPRFPIASRVVSPDSAVVCTSANSTTSLHKVGSGVTSNTDREVAVRGKLSLRSGNNAVLPTHLSFFTPHSANNNTNTNNIVEFPCSGSSKQSGSTSSDGIEPVVLPRLKAALSDPRLRNSSGNNGMLCATEGKNSSEKSGRVPVHSFVMGSNIQSVGDSLLLAKSMSGVTQTGANSTMRGLPIPLLRASPNPERRFLPLIHAGDVTYNKESVKQKESGADYVCDRHGRRSASPFPTKEALAAAETLQEESSGLPSSMLASPIVTRSFTPVRMQTGRSVDLRRLKGTNLNFF